MIEKKHIQTILGLTLALLVLGVAYWWYSTNAKVAQQTGEQTKNTISEGGIGAEISKGEGTITQIPVNLDLAVPGAAHPNLNRPIAFPDGYDADAKRIIQSNIATLTAQLKTDQNSFQAWMDLAVQYKIIEDLEGAREIWEFLNKAAPENTVSRVNLGNLYHYELKDFEKSEKNFKEAISINKEIPEAHLGLFELYRYSYKTNTNLAETTLIDAMTALPKNLTIRLTLAAQYHRIGRNAESKALYEETKTLAEGQGNTTVVAQIDAALAEF